MPDHVHLILTPSVNMERNKMFSLYEVLGSIKKYSARRINDRLRCCGSLRQQESFDHVLRSSESLDVKIAFSDNVGGVKQF
jgi:REP element-mobilizing transposase RayT